MLSLICTNSDVLTKRYIHRSQIKMFCGCGMALMWPKRSSRRTLPKEEEEDDTPRPKEDCSIPCNQATAVRFFTPAKYVNRNLFRRTPVPSPEPAMERDSASSIRE